MAVLDVEIERRAIEAGKALSSHGTVKSIYVFGSRVTGRTDEWSDIDIAAFMEEVSSWDLWERTRIIVNVQKIVGYDIEIHLFPDDSPEPGSFAADIVKNGVRIV